MSQADFEYFKLVDEILSVGEDRADRTGVGTRSIFGYQLRFDLTKGFPLLTSKKVAWKPIVSELLWFLEGSTDERRLAEILYGKPRAELTDKKTVWTANAQAPYWKPRAEFDGDLGNVYGKQWRSWNHITVESEPSGLEGLGGPYMEDVIKYRSIDQIDNVIRSLRAEPTSRRHMVVAYNPGEIDQMALPPCHAMFQFYVRDSKYLDCQLYQRSADVALGVPFNIASYALLTCMIAQIVRLKPGKFIHTFGDAHIYKNHIETIRQQKKFYDALRLAPRLVLNSDIKNINDFRMSDIKLEGYDPQPALTFEMAV